jgi:hypothetical protein
MKSLGGDGHPVLAGVVTAAEALRYALSLPVAAVVSGVDSREVLGQNLAIARGFAPMTPDEMETLRGRVAGAAADGRFELYKTTARFDAKVGREQHGFPSPESAGAAAASAAPGSASRAARPEAHAGFIARNAIGGTAAIVHNPPRIALPLSRRAGSSDERQTSASAWRQGLQNYDPLTQSATYLRFEVVSEYWT